MMARQTKQHTPNQNDLKTLALQQLEQRLLAGELTTSELVRVATMSQDEQDLPPWAQGDWVLMIQEG